MSRFLRMGTLFRAAASPGEILSAGHIFAYHHLPRFLYLPAWVMMYVNRHLVYRKSRWAPFSLLSSPTGCKRSEVNQQQEFLLPAQDALDYACISTRDFNFLYTELRLDSLKGHSLCNRVCSAVCFIY